MSDDDFIWRFTPSRTDPQLLEAIFVQREPLLVDLLERVAESATTASKHHVLLIGPRGFGKTHLITLLNHRLSKDATMSDRIRVAWLLEDETITSFVQLLKRIYEVLAQQYLTEFPLDWLQDLLTESPKRIRQQLEAKLVESFASRTLLLCIENLDFLFSGLGTSGQHDWRAFLQEHPFTTIIASTQRLFADVKSREKPFFGFFSPVPLEPLSVSDAVELLRRVAANRKATDLVAFLDSAEGRSRVRALHHLAGGNHRIYVVLSGFISRDSLDELVGPFQKMADDLTPYYQERLRWLSPQQRQIVEYLCSQDRPCIPKQIARQLLATENTISSQLKKLLEIGYVLRSECGRESLYELAEPLMRLASEVKEQEHRPLQMLVKFLRVWYRPIELTHFLQNASTDSLRRHLSAAIEAARTTPDPRIEIIEDEIAIARAENRVGEWLGAIEEKAHTTDSTDDWLQLAYAHAQLTQDHERSLYAFNRILVRDPYNVEAWRAKSGSMIALRLLKEALICCDQALTLNPTMADVWNNKGVALKLLKRNQEAIICYDRAIELNCEDSSPWYNKGNAMEALDCYDEAIICYDHLIRLDPNEADYWSRKGWVLFEAARFDESLACYEQALKLDSLDVDLWIDKGCVLNGMKRFEEAIACWDRAIERDPKDSVAWSNRGSACHQLRRFEEAIDCYDRAIEQNPNFSGPWNNKGLTLCKLALFGEAITHFDRAIELDPDAEGAWNNRLEVLFRMGRYQEGLIQLRSIFARFGGGVEREIETELGLLRATMAVDSHVVRQFCDLHAEFRGLVQLSDGLVRSLAKIAMETTTPSSLQKWRDFWTDWGTPHAEMQVPLRLFSTGVDYLIKQDPKVLLDLVVSERQILGQVLGIDVS